MILLEGPDGTGKTNLSRRLSEALELPIHSRASDSVSGPVADLWGWVVNDVHTWDSQELSIYDRHPMISEYIYGPIIRGSVPPGLLGPSAKAVLHFMAQQALVVFCLPPIETVRKNVLNDDVPQMAGVRGNTDALYYAYAGRRASWPGWAIDYDYSILEGKGSFDSVLRSARLHIATWKRK